MQSFPHGPGQLQRFNRLVQQGIDTLGPLVTLIDVGMEIETAQHRYRGVLEYLERLPANLQQQPYWLALRGDALVQMGDRAAARESYQTALATLQKLPDSRRNSRALVAQHKRLTDKLKVLQ